MTFKVFNKLISLKNCIISLSSFLIATFYIIFRNDQFSGFNFFVFFIIILFMDMSTSGIKNYMRYLKILSVDGTPFEKSLGVKKSTAESILLIFFSITLLFFIILFFNTNYFIRILSVFFIIKGVQFAYSSIGSKVTFYEVYSGILVFFFIYFLSIYIHIYNQELISISFFKMIITVNLYSYELVGIIFLSLPTLFSLVAYYLAKDISNQKNPKLKFSVSLAKLLNENICFILLSFLYIFSYCSIIYLVVLNYVSSVYIFALMSSIRVFNNYKSFSNSDKNQESLSFIKENIYVMNGSNLFFMVLIVLIQDYVNKL